MDLKWPRPYQSKTVEIGPTSAITTRVSSIMNGHPMNNGESRGLEPQSSQQSNVGRPCHSRRISPPLRVRFDDTGKDQERFEPLEIALDTFAGLLCAGCVAGLGTVLVILYVTVRPFSVPKYRKLACQWGAASFLDALVLLLPNIKIHLTDDSDLPSPVGTSLLVSNHLMDGDWWSVLMLGRCVGIRGSVKVFLRNEYLHINMDNDEASPRSASASSTAMLNPSNHSLTTSIGLARDHIPYSHGERSHHNPHDLSILAKLLHLFLEFPLINGEDYTSNRDQLFQLLRSFAEDDETSAPVQLLFFPEGWSQHNGDDRRSILAKSNEFAKREGRPQLKHLLLPRARGFKSSLECMREANPVVYDVTLVHSDYDGSLPPSEKLSLYSLWILFRRSFPTELYMRIKRYDMEEVVQDAAWLDKRWAEKDRRLSFFSKNNTFPSNRGGACRYRTFNSRSYSTEASILALFKLLFVPCVVPFLMMLSVPLFWTLLAIWVANRAFVSIFRRSGLRSSDSDSMHDGNDDAGTACGSNSAGTPFVPATPFGSPLISSWRDFFSYREEANR